MNGALIVMFYSSLIGSEFVDYVLIFYLIIKNSLSLACNAKPRSI